MNFIRPSSKPALIAIMVALLSACQSAPTHLYTLYSVPPIASNSVYAGAPLRVDAVHFPPALDRIEMVRDGTPGVMSLSDVDQWSAPLSQAARQALSADLVLRLPGGKALFPHLMKPDGALGLTVDVLNFTCDRREARLQAGWVVGAAGASSVTSSGSVILLTETAGNDAAATAQTLSKLLGELADRIVAAL